MVLIKCILLEKPQSLMQFPSWHKLKFIFLCWFLHSANMTVLLHHLFCYNNTSLFSTTKLNTKVVHLLNVTFVLNPGQIGTLCIPLVVYPYPVKGMQRVLICPWFKTNVMLRRWTTLVFNLVIKKREMLLYQFLTSGSGQTENTQIWVFSVWPKVENWFWKQILN